MASGDGFKTAASGFFTTIGKFLETKANSEFEKDNLLKSILYVAGSQASNGIAIEINRNNSQENKNENETNLNNNNTNSNNNSSTQQTKPQRNNNTTSTETDTSVNDSLAQTTQDRSPANVDATQNNKAQTANSNNSDYISDMIKSIFGKFNEINQNKAENRAVCALIVINNYFGNSDAQNNTVMIFINDISQFSNANEHINAAVNNSNQLSNNNQARQEEENSNLIDNQVSENTQTEQPSQTENMQVASNEVKAIYNVAINIYHADTIILDYSNGKAEILSNDQDRKDDLIAEVAALENIDKIQDNTKTYDVIKGDALWQIAKDNNATLEELKEANEWTKNRFSDDGKFALIYPGEQLLIPCSIENMVKRETGASEKDIDRVTKDAIAQADEKKDNESKNENIDSLRAVQ